MLLHMHGFCVRMHRKGGVHMPILGSWSGMRKYLEEEMLCEALRGRVRYHLTTYPNMDKAGHFEVFVDGESRKMFSMDYAASQMYSASDKSVGMWQNFWTQRENAQAHQQFDDMQFAEALAEYRSVKIQDAICSENAIVRMFAVLDRRLGKRMLCALKERISEQPEWLQFFYTLRLTSEKIN